MRSRLCFIIAGAVLLIAIISFDGIRAPFQINGAPVNFTAFDVTSAEHQKEVVIDERFKVSEGDELMIDVGHADVSVRTGSGSEAAVQVTVDGGRARRFFEHLNFSVEQRGGTVSITTNPRGSWNRGGGDIDVLVTVPERFDADIDLAHGDLDVERLNGKLNFRLAHGDFEAKSLSGSALEIELAHGDFEGGRLMSEKVKLHAAHGDVSVASLTAADFDVDVQHGDVEIDRAEGYARISGAHSDIEIAFAKLNGGEFSNSHGDIDIAAPSGAAADVDFQAEEIDISSGHSFQGTLKDKRAQGRISGGGPKMVARTSHGEISFREL